MIRLIFPTLKERKRIHFRLREKKSKFIFIKLRTDDTKIERVLKKLGEFKEEEDTFERALKLKIDENQNKIKISKPKEEEKKQKKDEEEFEVDSDGNLESYYNYSVEIVSFFYMVTKKIIT